MYAEYFDWSEPSGGMFLWLRSKTLEDTKQLALEKAWDRKVSVYTY